MRYERVRVVTNDEIAGEQAGALVGFLYSKIPSLRLLLTLLFLYLPLWWLIGAATEFSGGLILSPLLGLAASAATYLLLRRMIVGYQYDPKLAVLGALLVGVLLAMAADATAFGRSHRDDLWGLGLLYVAGVAVLFFKFGGLVRRVLTPVFVLLYGALMLALAAPLMAGSARLLVRPVISRAMEVPLVWVQFFGGSQMGRVYAVVDERNVRAQCEVGRLVRVPAADVLAGKPLPDDTRRASCRVMSPFQPAFVCPDPAQMARVHSSVLKACENWRQQLKS